MENVLVTGANGFLGSLICKNMKKYNIFSLSRNNTDYNISLENNVPKFKDHFDLVVHAAGKAHIIPKTQTDAQEFHDVNVLGTANLLSGLEMVGLPKAFIFISSVSVYGKESGTLIDENTPLLAKDPYGKSKIDAEKIIVKWCQKNNVTCSILRLPLLVGENPPGNLGDMIKAIKKGYYFNIGGGKSKKSMLLAKDVANIIHTVAKVGGVYNLTDGLHPSFLELSNTIANKIGKKASPNIPFWLAKIMAYCGDIIGNNAPINSKKLEKINSNLTFDDSKAREMLGWKPDAVLKNITINL